MKMNEPLKKTTRMEPSLIRLKQGYSSEQVQFDQIASILMPKGKTTTTDLEKSGL